MELKVLGRDAHRNLQILNFRGTRYVAGWYEVERGPRALVKGHDRRWVLASVSEVEVVLGGNAHCLELDEYAALNHCTRDSEEVVKSAVQALFVG